MKTKALIKRITDSRIFWAVFSLAASVLVWVFVTNTEGVEKQTYYGVQVRFLGEDTLRESSGLIVTHVDRTTVDLTLSGPRRLLAKLSADNLEVTIDLSKVTYTGNNRWGYTIRFPTGIDGSQIQKVGSSADIINFYVDKLSTKPIEVKGRFDGSVAEGYMAEDPVFDPLSVRISGPQASIDKVSHAWISITRQDVDTTLQYQSGYILVDADGNEVTDESIILETPEVFVRLTVLTIKEIPLTVTIVDGGGATSGDTVVDVDPPTVSLSGDADVMNGINKLVLGTIDLAMVDAGYEKAYPIILPDNTEILSGVREAQVSVQIKGLATKKMEVTHFACENVTSGYTAKVITESMEVTVRARPEILDRIKPENLRAVADLTDIGETVGVFSSAVKVHIDGFPGAGVVGEYKITVSLSAS